MKQIGAVEVLKALKEMEVDVAPESMGSEERYVAKNESRYSSSNNKPR